MSNFWRDFYDGFILLYGFLFFCFNLLNLSLFQWDAVCQQILHEMGNWYLSKLDAQNGIQTGRRKTRTFSAKYFTSAGHRVRQSTLRAGHSQFVPVFCI